MTTINKLTAVSPATAGMNLPVYSPDNGDARRISVSDLLAYMQANLTFTDPGIAEFAAQYAAPSATAFDVQITDGTDNVWLRLTPTGVFADGEITLPSAPVANQEVLVNSTQVVTAFVVDGNGKTVTGAPTALAANDFFRLKYDDVNSTWYRVG